MLTTDAQVAQGCAWRHGSGEVDASHLARSGVVAVERIACEEPDDSVFSRYDVSHRILYTHLRGTDRDGSQMFAHLEMQSVAVTDIKHACRSEDRLSISDGGKDALEMVGTFLQDKDAFRRGGIERAVSVFTEIKDIGGSASFAVEGEGDDALAVIAADSVACSQPHLSEMVGEDRGHGLTG